MSKSLKDLKDEVISMEAFLVKCCGFFNVNNKKITHEKISNLFPNIKKCSYEEIIKNPDFIYTGKVALVRDFKGELIPYYLEQFNKFDEFKLDNREKLIVELVLSITQIVNELNEILIILENNDCIINNLVGLECLNIDICSSEFVKNNNYGGILVTNQNNIYKFKYLLNILLNYNQICYSKNCQNTNELSQRKDIISINTTSKGRVYVTYNGIVSEKMNSIDIRNFLLKNYHPKTEITKKKEVYDLSSLKNYELEYLYKKCYKEKNMPMYFKFKEEYNKRMKEEKEKLSEYRNIKRKIKIKLEEE